ncbi:transcriptional regulator, TetR family [Parvibaculum lavamentivorans DS-1]|uniref:Transcriptional regulator, TetR family n=1 Tax=Parvibaculum lavamentivorans (strain DS-1 / DSM 13023 / NCIMB 13966) TaxID=402881 RepID=A7HX25_PARL1|nr:TetR/AcrR family transcriptional regulator [Parvibaculum lavamentivorans]ABS64458.1 transcriptional regulator, TetR family [Parvibaculum lavamentivorans DS-1]
MTVSGKSGPGRPRDQAADAAILGAALEIFIERGAAGTTVEEVAKRAGVARTTLYRRWTSKNELLADAVASVRLATEAAADDWRGLSLPDVLKLTIKEVPRLMAQPMARPLAAQLLAAPELFKIYYDGVLAPRMAAFQLLLDQAQRDGLIPRSVDTKMLHAMMAGAFTNLLLLRTEPPTEAQARAYLRRLVAALGLKEILRQGAP